MATNELKTSKVRRLRGSASIREDGTFDFHPDGHEIPLRMRCTGTFARFPLC